MKKLAPILVIGLAFLIPWRLWSSAEANSTGIVRIDPGTNMVLLGYRSEATITGVNIDDVYGVELTVAYSPTLVSINDSNSG